ESRSEMWLPLGNGRYNKSAQPPEKPAGACMYLNAKTGKVIWRFDTPDAVFSQPACYSDYAAQRLFVGCRDGNVYCLQALAGTLYWKYHTGSAIVASPCVSDGVVYVLGSDGRVCALDQRSGANRWTFDVANFTRTKAQLFSSPTVIEPLEAN